MGMSYEQFWYGAPEMATAYRKAYAISQRAMNQQAWLMGAYNHAAFNTTLGNAFRRKGAPAKPYIEPLDIFPKTPEERKAAERREWERIDRQMREMMKKQRKKTRKGGA